MWEEEYFAKIFVTNSFRNPGPLVARNILYAHVTSCQLDYEIEGQKKNSSVLNKL